MKKITTLLFVLLHLGFDTSYAMQDTIVMYTSDMEVSPGTQVCIPIQVNNFNDIVSFQFGVTWNPEILSFTEILNTTLRDVKAGTTQSDDGILRLLWFDSALSPSTLADSESVIEVCFNVLATSESSTSLVITEFSELKIEITNIDNEILPYQIESGTISINTTAIPESEISVRIVNGEPISLFINDIPFNQRGGSLYSFSNSVLTDEDNIVEINPNEPKFDNISTLDMVMMYKALVSEKSSPTMSIAMDVDLSGSLTTKDLLTIRKNILGIEPLVHIGKQFIIETARDFTDFNLLSFNNSFAQYIFNLDEIDPTEGLNFEVFEYGDVSGADSDYHKNKVEPIEIALDIKNQAVSANEMIEVPIIINNPEKIIGLSLLLKAQDLIINDIEHPYANSILQYHQNNPQSLSLSFLSPEKELPFEMILRVTPMIDGILSDMISIDPYLTPEVVIVDRETGLLHLEWSKIQDKNDRKSEVCYYPNPTSELLNIVAPEEYIGGRLSVYNILGAEIYHTSINALETQINLSDYQRKGIILIRIQHGELRDSFRVMIE